MLNRSPFVSFLLNLTVVLCATCAALTEAEPAAKPREIIPFDADLRSPDVPHDWNAEGLINPHPAGEIRFNATASGPSSAAAPRQMERLGRGVVAVNQGEGKAFVSWRLLGTEPDSIAFNIYRMTGSGQPVKLNTTPLTQATCYQDSGVDFSQPVSYTVRAVLNDQEQRASAPFKFPANAPVRQYLSIPLQAGRGVPNDASVGDLNGDGEYEVVLKREDGSRDNSRGGVTGSTTLEAYALDGTFMWKIDLGKNIPLNSIPK
jgi:hypothetical protein